MSNNNIAIVGANSILGQAIYEKLYGDYNVFQVYHSNTDNIKHKSNLIQIDDFLKTDLVFEVIYYISSVISFEESSDTIKTIFETNVSLLKVISDKFETSKLIHSSSVSVYELSNDIITEKSSVSPQSSYALSKLWAEQIVNDHKGIGINIRLSSLFGIGMKKQSFLPRIIQDAIALKQITLFGDGSRKQNYISVEEASDYFCKAIDCSGKALLLAVGKQSYSNKEVAQIVAQMLQDIKIIFNGNDDSAGFQYDNSFTKEELKINKEYSFSESINSVVQWMQKQY